MAVLHGTEIAIQPIPDVDTRVLRATILTHGFGLLLRQRGSIVLHASSVAKDGKAVAFVGNAGRGKSSLALALLEQGFTLVADDVTALKLKELHALAIPAFPQINIEPAVAEVFLHDARTLDRVNPVEEKRVVLVKDRFLDCPRPLTHIFELHQGGAVAVVRLGLSEAFMMLLAHTYRAFFSTAEEAAYMSQLANLVKLTPVFRITVPQSLAELPAVARHIAAFLQDATD